MKFIPLTQGYEAIVDDDCYDRLMVYKYFAAETRLCGNVYVAAARWLRGIKPRRCVRLPYDVLQITVVPGILIDHKNRNPLDNRKDNLRLTDKQGNAQNSDRVINASGIYYDRCRDRYKAFHLFGDGTKQYIGTYRTSEEAKIAKYGTGNS